MTGLERIFSTYKLHKLQKEQTYLKQLDQAHSQLRSLVASYIEGKTPYEVYRQRANELHEIVKLDLRACGSKLRT